MRLTKLYIHNYKSFYDTTIELDKLNIVVGENNSGKSNLIDVLEFIDIAMSKDIERAIDDKGGYDKIKNYSAVGEKKVVIRATFEIDKKGNGGILSGALFDGFITLSFSFTKKYSYLTWCIDVSVIKYIHSIKKYFNNINKNKEKFIIFSKSNWSNYKGEFLEDDIYINSRLSTYYFDTNLIRKESSNENINDLKKDGSNLGKNLFYIKSKDKKRFEAISNSLITTVNEIDGIDVYNIAGSYIIVFKEGDREININTVSDGTINLLATITALNQIIGDRPWGVGDFLLIFEEPERHLHFKVVNYLLDSFRNHNKQILITSHSTEMLKYANLNEVIFIYRDSEGDTQTIRADKIPNLKEKMEYMKYERTMTLDEMLDEDMVWDFE